jgi:hypothetical protein
MSGQTSSAAVDRATVLVADARRDGVALKVLGGVGCWLHIHDHAAGPVAAGTFARPYGDVDLVVPRAARRRIGPFLEAHDLEPARSFNAVQGETRLMFHGGDLKVDVFLGSFTMCHEIAMDDQAFEPASHPVLRLAELLLTKLQVVRVTDKDLRDAAALLAFHPVADGGDAETVDAGRIAELLGRDWGLWRTVTANLDVLDTWVAEHGPEGAVASVRAGTAGLRRAIDERPKSRGWRVRAKIGERKLWYEEPEEPEMHSERIR